MSTRATYSFAINKLNENNLVHYYIHNDNYPEGAAAYLLAMYEICNHVKAPAAQSLSVKWDSLASGFLVANPCDVEFTLNHETHTDTEYRYFITGEGMLRAEKIHYGSDDVSWIEFFNGHYTQFINQYYPEQKDPNFEPIHHLDINYNNRNQTIYMTKKNVERILKDKWLSSIVDSDKVEALEEYHRWREVYPQAIKAEQNFNAGT